jgi:hypothetical protein
MSFTQTFLRRHREIASINSAKAIDNPAKTNGTKQDKLENLP